ncbi:MAG: RHS repeat-associated core domain-containing protein [Sedimenticola sp.]
MTRIGQVFAYALLLLFAGTTWGTPLTELVDRYGLSGGLIQVTPEATVEMPDGVLTARFELFRFAPSPYEMTLHLEYRDGSLGKPALATGWRLEGVPSDGLVAGWHVQWDRNGRVTSRSDDSGNHIDYSYDDKGQLTEVINQAGQGWRFSYENDGSINRITGTDGREFNVVRNPQRLLTEITTHQGTWHFEYDDNQHISRFRNPGGRWIELTLDEKGRVTGVAGKERYSFSYQASAKELEVVMRKGIEPTRTFRFDPAHRWTSSSIENGPTVTSQMSNKGELTEISDSSGRAERYEYDRRMRLTRVTGSDGATTNIDNGRHGPKRITGPTGLVTEINYDRLGREISTREENRETLSRYDRSGRLSQVTNPDGGSERYRYSLEGHRIETVGVDQQSLTSSYDDKGRQSRISKGGVNTEIRHYVDDRLESVTVNGTTFTRYEYDPAGQLKRIENEGVSRRYTWDDNERLVEILEGDNSCLSLQYDQSGQLSQLQLADGTSSQFWYNRQGLIELKDLGVTQKSFRYDPVGRISEIRNGRGQQINYAYDPADRLSRVTTSDGTRISLEYDPGGETQRISTETADQTIGRDRFGNPVTISDSRFSEPVKLEFDASDRISSIHFGDNNTTRYQHESSGLLKSVQLPWGGSIGFDNHDGKRSLTRLPNGATVEYARDNAGRLNGMTLRNPDGQQLDSIGYRFDGYGRVTGEQGKWQVKRDKRGQISQFAPQSGKTESYRYDPRGNLLSAADGSYEYDKLNRLTRSPGSTYVYDADGNLERLGGQRKLKYEWDALNRLTAILGSPFGDVHYGYDALGRRVSKRINESEVRYFWLDDHILLHADSSGQPVRQLVQGQRVDEVLAINIAGEPFYPVQDGLGDIRWLLDKTGKLIATFRFDPWGNLVEGSPEWLARLELGYRGRDYDVESGLYYMRARYYSPIMKRFVSVDPEDGEFEQPRSFNPYLYALNAPLDFVDPYGTSAETPLDWAGRQIGEATYGVYRGFRWAGGKAYNAAHAVFQPLVAIKQGKFTEKYISKPAEKLRDGAMQSLERGLDAGGAFTTYREGIEDDPRRLETVGADAQRRLQRLSGIVQAAGGRFSAPVQSIYEAAAIASNPNEKEALQQAAAWVMKNTEAMAQSLIDIPKNATKDQIKNAILGAIKNNPRIKDRLANLGDKSGFLIDKALDKFADKMAGEIVKHPTKPIEDAIKGQKTPQNVQHMKQAYNQLERELNSVVSAKAKAVQAAMAKVKSEAERAKALATKVGNTAAKIKAADSHFMQISIACSRLDDAVYDAGLSANLCEKGEKKVQADIDKAQALAANCKDAATANEISNLYGKARTTTVAIALQGGNATMAADRAVEELSKAQSAKQKINAVKSLLPQMNGDATAAEEASTLAVQAAKTAVEKLASFKSASNALIGSIDRVAKGVPDDRKDLKNQFNALISRAKALANSLTDTSAADVSAARVAAGNAKQTAAKTKLPEGDTDCKRGVPDDAVSRAENAYTGALIFLGAGAGLPQVAADCLAAAQGGSTGQGSGSQQGGTSGQTAGNQGQSGGDSGDSGGDDFDDFDASTDPGMGSGPSDQQIAQTSQAGDQFQTGVPGDASSSGGRPQGGQTGQQIGSSYTDPGTPIGGSGTGDTSSGGTTGTAGTGSTGTQTAGTGGPAGQQAGDDWDNYITSGPQISSAGATGTTGSTAGTTGTGSGTSSGSGTGTGGGQYIAACNRGDGKIVVTKSFSTSNHISMSSGFSTEREAITWVTNSCPTWRCNKSSGACDTNPGDSTGVGTYSTGDVTSTFGSVWKRVGCSLGGPHICWGSGGRTMADGDGDGRADILLHGSVHWKNVGGSSSPITK